MTSGIDRLAADLAAHVATSSSRYVLGVAGPPGSGKSLVAARIVDIAAPHVSACVAPLDGFHRNNEELTALGLLALKGAPDSFDAAAFVERLRRVRTAGGPIVWPTYDRAQEEVVPDGSVIGGEVRLVVVEGNYLLLRTPPWDEVRPLLDAVWYLDVPEDVLIPRLRTRHERHRSPADAWAKVRATDLPNAALVARTRERADVVISPGGGDD